MRRYVECHGSFFQKRALRIGTALLLTCLCIGLPRGAFSQQTSDLFVILTPNQSGHFFYEEGGMITLPGDSLSHPYILRYPEKTEQWNGTLLIGLSGGPVTRPYRRDAWPWRQTDLDYVVGFAAMDSGYSYAMMGVDGSDPQAFALTMVFTTYIRERLQDAYDRVATHTYLAGVSRGGGIARTAAESDNPVYDGFLIVSGSGGDEPAWLERQARIITLWPQVDPAKAPDLPDTSRQVVAYADLVGTPVAARPLWGRLGWNLRLSNFRKTLVDYGLLDLTDDQVKQFRVESFQHIPIFKTRLAERTTSGMVRVPTMELVGAWDDFVGPEVLVYKAKVLQVSRGMPTPTPADRYRLYQITGIWHISKELDFSLAYCRAAFPVIHEALIQLDRWVKHQTPPPPDQELAPKRPLPQHDQAIRKRLTGLPLILEGHQVNDGVARVLQTAREIAAQNQHYDIGTDHLFLSLLREEPVADALRRTGIAVDSLTHTLMSRKKPGFQWRPFILSELARSEWKMITAQPVDGVRTHTGPVTRIGRTGIEMNLDGRRRLILLTQVVGDIQIRSTRFGDISWPADRFPWAQERLHVTTNQDIDGTRTLTGVLQYFDTQTLVLAYEGTTREIPMDHINAVGFIPDQSQPIPLDRITYDISVNQVVKAALQDAEARQAGEMDVMCLLRGLIRVHKGNVVSVLDQYGIDESTITAFK